MNFQKLSFTLFLAIFFNQSFAMDVDGACAAVEGFDDDLPVFADDTKACDAEVAKIVGGRTMEDLLSVRAKNNTNHDYQRFMRSRASVNPEQAQRKTEIDRGLREAPAVRQRTPRKEGGAKRPAHPVKTGTGRVKRANTKVVEKRHHATLPTVQEENEDLMDYQS